MYTSTTETEPTTPEADAPAGPDQANVVLFLALYLILLAFFIMLNSNAEISEARARAVLAGITIAPVELAPRPDGPLTLVADALEAQLVELFDGHMDRGEWRLQASEGLIAVSMPQRKAFGADSSILRPTRIAMVNRLAALLGETGANERLDLVLVMGDAGDTSLARRRAAALGGDLIRNGVDPARFALRVQRDPSASIEFLLQPAPEA
ncbi:hypothetical protein [Minwuia thermotolerans]|uniref:Motility protein B-like N-terminal domain-containing protein n=1 Tax=Minwuia thermotolerans TaxID=2056226 RepID=A0A2M9FXQ6_9PROT|nr:hypothetical protein [Minwuia thermotolerans]PJK28246.1 hypothetical protein CVT23_17900 [Minwuia thermotolerans]